MKAHLPSTFPPGHVFRTRDLAPISANPTRLVKRWVREGVCTQLRNGLYAVAERTRFGATPPDRSALLRGFLQGDPFVVTGPPAWNALGLGATQMFAHPLVYNRKRSGLFRLGGRAFRLSRTRFPDQPGPEWFVVDLLENLATACLDPAEVEKRLAERLEMGAFSPNLLLEMATEYGTRATLALVQRALGMTR